YRHSLSRARSVLNLCNLERIRHLFERKIVTLEIYIDQARKSGLRLQGGFRSLGRRAHRGHYWLFCVLISPLYIKVCVTVFEVGCSCLPLGLTTFSRRFFGSFSD